MTNRQDTPLLVLRQLVKRYPTGDLALDHVDLSARSPVG